MGILQGSKADILAPQVGKQAIFVGLFVITAPDAIAETIPNFELLLEEPGTYLMFAAIRAQLEISSGIDAAIALEMRTTLVGGGPLDLVVGACGLAAMVGELNVRNDGVGVAIGTLTVTEPLIVTTSVTRKGFQAPAPTYTVSQILGDGNGSVTMTALQIIP